MSPPRDPVTAEPIDEPVAEDAPVLTRAADDGRQRHFPCSTCGSQLVVAPGATVLRCPSCGAEEIIPLSAQAIREQSLAEWQPPAPQLGLGDTGHVPLVCAGCGAAVDGLPAIAAQPCPYCGGHLQRKELPDTIRPEAVVPFLLDRKAAETAIQTWISKRWFAPSDLKHLAHLEGFRDVYLPFFTFDSHTVSHYSGQAGFHYYVTVGSGKNRRQERRTRWTSRSGVHEDFFDDELVPAATVSNGDRSWKTASAKAYMPAQLAGTTALRAERDPQDGWREAKAAIEGRLYTICCGKIGGDVQRLVQVVTAHRGISWKLILVPRWEGGYRYRQRRFMLTVNGQNGSVQGDRPWSRWKITGAVIFGLVLLAVVAFVVIEVRSQSASTPVSAPLERYGPADYP